MQQKETFIPKVYGFNFIELLKSIILIPFVTFIFYSYFYLASDGRAIIDKFVLVIIATSLIVTIKQVYNIISTNIVLYDDHLLYKSSKQIIQMKYGHISSIKLNVDIVRIKDIYGNTLHLPFRQVRNAQQAIDIIIDEAVNAKVEKDENSNERSKYIIICRKCRKEFYLKTPTGKCPVCGTKHLQLNFDMNFRLVKNEKHNERILLAFWTAVVIGVLLFIYYFNFR